MEKRKKQSEVSSTLFSHQLVTLADLEKFKSREVRKLIDVSPGKLHAMRVSRQISFMRIGGVIYYDRADIEKMFEKVEISAVK